MDRGTRLEDDAVARFVKETGKQVDTSLVIWSRDDNDSIAVSPDGFIGNTEAVEAKCLASARHIEAYLTKEIPDEYKMQAIQYFIVNDDLCYLHFVFYDPRIPVKDYFTITLSRDDLQDEIDEYLEYQVNVLKEVDDIVNELTF